VADCISKNKCITKTKSQSSTDNIDENRYEDTSSSSVVVPESVPCSNDLLVRKSIKRKSDEIEAFESRSKIPKRVTWLDDFGGDLVTLIDDENKKDASSADALSAFDSQICDSFLSLHGYNDSLVDGNAPGKPYLNSIDSDQYKSPFPSMHDGLAFKSLDEGKNISDQTENDKHVGIKRTFSCYLENKSPT
jgi:hypothetical protein